VSLHEEFIAQGQPFLQRICLAFSSLEYVTMH